MARAARLQGERGERIPRPTTLPPGASQQVLKVPSDKAGVIIGRGTCTGRLVVAPNGAILIAHGSACALVYLGVAQVVRQFGIWSA